MDLERRLGEGRIAQLAGPAGLSSDKFELRLGLLRTAQAEWAATPRTSPRPQALIAYSRGVNDYLAQARRTGEWPSLFGLTGVYPAPWTPIDSLVLQGVLTQELDYTTTPLDYAILERTLGPAHTMAWFPILPPRPGSPPTTPAPTTTAASPPSPPKPARPATAPATTAAAKEPAAGGPVAVGGEGPAAQRGSKTGSSKRTGSGGKTGSSKGAGAGPAARVASPAEPSSSRASGTTAVTTADDRQRAEAPVSGPGPGTQPDPGPSRHRRSGHAGPGQCAAPRPDP